MTDKLEETLSHIRSDLTNLSTDRMAMEMKMEGLVTDIQVLANSLYNYKRPQSQQQISPVRRVRSSTASSKSSIKKRGSIGKQFPSFRRESSHRSGSVSSSSSDSIRGRSSSASSSKKGQTGWFSHDAGRMGDRSISVEGPWTHSDIAIPELPESPSLISVASCSYSSGLSSQDSMLSGNYLRRMEPAVPPTPPYWQSTQQYCSSLVTSTPNIQDCGAEFPGSDNYYTLPSKITSKGKRQHCMMFSSDNLDEVDGCLEETSLSQDNAFVVRRSSLTGQLEHFQGPQGKERSIGVIVRSGTPGGYRVLNKGVRKSLKRRSSSRLDQVILPSVETTV